MAGATGRPVARSRSAAGAAAPVPDTIMEGWSIEATLPKPEDLDALAAMAPPGTEVFLSTLPHVGLDRQIETAGRLREVGLEPVPHVAARYFATTAALGDFLFDLVGEADVRSVLVVGGDLDPPRGAFASSLDLIRSGLLQAHGIDGVGFAGYPDGHPQIRDDVLDGALDDKLEAAAAAGLKPRVVTQFCFRSEPIRDWLGRFHARHAGVPVRVGLAGPASVKALVRYALRCGVGAPIDGLGHKLSMAGKLARGVSPAGILRELDAAGAVAGSGGPVAAHFFSFGGLERTGRWAAAAAAGDFT